MERKPENQHHLPVLPQEPAGYQSGHFLSVISRQLPLPCPLGRWGVEVPPHGCSLFLPLQIPQASHSPRKEMKPALPSLLLPLVTNQSHTL